MKIKSVATICLFILAGFIFTGFTLFDSEPIQKIVSQLKKWSDSSSPEKVYLQFDKTCYAAGEDVWFKAYVVAANGHHLSSKSAVLNFELINPDKQTEHAIKIPISMGLGWADFALPRTLKAGTYYIRAYTNYMLKAGNESVFYSPVTIVNPLLSAKPVLPATAKANKVDLQFFAEGGNMINGVQGKLAFKAIGSNGLGIDVKGRIVDNLNAAVATFASANIGMGYIPFTPISGKTYKAIIALPNGTEATYPLPNALNSGIALSVLNNESDSVWVNVKSSGDVVSAAGTEVIVIGQQNGEVHYASQTLINKPMLTAPIPKKRFSTGIVQFTLFTIDGQPLAERLVFINNRTGLLNLSVSSSQPGYDARQNVKLNISAKNFENKPAVGSFSVSVIDENKVPVDELNDPNILSNLLLTSDLKGYIEKPNYYFNEITPQTRANLDVLMLTQGYRHFVWKDIMDNKFADSEYLSEEGLNISGQIKNLTGKPVANGRVTLMNTTRGLFLLDTVTDAKGRFVFNNLLFPDDTKFVLQAIGTKEKNSVQVLVDSAHVPRFSLPYAPLAVPNTAAYNQNSKLQYNEFEKFGWPNGAINLNEVVVTEKKAPLVKHSANLNGAGVADQIITAKDLEHSASIYLTQILQSRINGVTFAGGKAYLNRASFSTPMRIVLDGLITEDSSLDLIDISSVESIEVLKSLANSALYGSMGGGGVLVITTKRGEMNDKIEYRKSPDVITYKPKGYYAARQFYKPQYDNPKTNTTLADLRSTIHWEPNLITDKAGNTSIEFANAGKGNYRVIIEGINNEGDIGRQVYRYEVK